MLRPRQRAQYMAWLAATCRNRDWSAVHSDIENEASAGRRSTEVDMKSIVVLGSALVGTFACLASPARAQSSSWDSPAATGAARTSPSSSVPSGQPAPGATAAPGAVYGAAPTAAGTAGTVSPVPASPPPAAPVPVGAPVPMTAVVPAATTPAVATPASATVGALPPSSPSIAASPTALGASSAASAEGPRQLSDHESLMYHVGFGWYGSPSVPYMDGANSTKNVDVPLIGARIWFTPTLGLDVALGAWLHSGESKSSTTSASGSTSSTTTPDWNVLAFAGGLGMPVSILHRSHYSLQITPEVAFGWVGLSRDPAKTTPSTSSTGTGTGTGSGSSGSGGSSSTSSTMPKPSGFIVQAGAKVGAEVHFGFMGIPQLALDASFGLFLAYQYAKVDVGSTTYEQSQLLFASSQINTPWDIFRSTVAARYYF